MNTFVNRLRKEVLNCSIKGIKLEHDLRRITKVYSCGATEAVVFYSARILEAVMKEAHSRFFGEDRSGKRDDPPLAGIENKLFNYNQLPQQTYYWSQGLRLLGNNVRHSQRRVTTGEADCALLFLEFILTWYLCEFSQGQRQATICHAESGLPQFPRNILVDLALALNSGVPNPSISSIIFGPRSEEYSNSFRHNLVFPIVLVQIFIDQGDYTSASHLINSLIPYIGKSTGAFGNRFQQLRALLLSRQYKLEDALEIIEPDYIERMKLQPRRIDDETAGILAGIYKHLWQRDKIDNFLEKSHAAYAAGWHLNKNPYLGINAASTALWLDKAEEPKVIAKEVKYQLERRRQLIRQKTSSRYDLNYWDLVTLAEANVLVHDLDSAKDLYGLAFAGNRDQTEIIAVTRTQLFGLANKLGLTSDIVKDW